MSKGKNTIRRFLVGYVIRIGKELYFNTDLITTTDERFVSKKAAQKEILDRVHERDSRTQYRTVHIEILNVHEFNSKKDYEDWIK